MLEEWKDIPNWKGYYQVSTLGNFKSLDRIIINKNGKKFKVNGRIIIPKRIKFNPYLGVYLRKAGKYKIMNVHKLVALTFLEKGNNECVNHKNGNKLDNRLENLEWTTFSENQKHAIHITKVKKVKSGNQVWKATKVYQYDLYGDLIDTYPTLQTASKWSKVHRATIGDCCNNKVSTAGNFIWSYKQMNKAHFQQLQTKFYNYTINGGRCPIFSKGITNKENNN